MTAQALKSGHRNNHAMVGHRTLSKDEICDRWIGDVQITSTGNSLVIRLPYKDFGQMDLIKGEVVRMMIWRPDEIKKKAKKAAANAAKEAEQKPESE